MSNGKIPIRRKRTRMIGKKGIPFSEVSMTINDPRINKGRPTNIPSVFGGILTSPKDAINYIAKNKGVDPDTGRILRAFDSIPQAVNAAKLRSVLLGMGLPGLPGKKY